MLHHLAIKEMKCSLLSHFKPSSTLSIFVLGKIKQKLQMIRQQCLQLSKAQVHLGGQDFPSIATASISTLIDPQTFWSFCWPYSNKIGLC